jgi:RNA polymerase sigma-70 factor (ECF subfamily)
MTEVQMDKIYRAFHDKVMGYIRARINRWADAEDLCADVFEKVQRKLPEFDRTKAQIGTWIFTITRNTVIDFFRRSKPTEELDENLSDDSEVDENLLQNESLEELAAALRRMPEELRDLIVLRYYDNRPLTEVAEMMGLSYGAVKLRHQKALGLLRKALTA